MSLLLLMQVLGLAPPLIINGGPDISGGDSGESACGDPGVTGITNAVASGGVAPYTYQWTLVSAPATKGPWIPASASNPSTIFGGSANVCDFEVVSETWEIEATDADLNTATDTITVTRRWTDIR